MCLPCLYGSYVVTGNLQRAALTFLEDIIPFAPFSGKLLVDYYSKAAEKVIVIASKQTNKVLEFLPKIMAGQTWTNAPFIKVEAINKDLEDILVNTIPAIDKDLAEI